VNKIINLIRIFSSSSYAAGFGRGYFCGWGGNLDAEAWLYHGIKAIPEPRRMECFLQAETAEKIR
jgi:hypothetical protein